MSAAARGGTFGWPRRGVSDVSCAVEWGAEVDQEDAAARDDVEVEDAYDPEASWVEDDEEDEDDADDDKMDIEGERVRVQADALVVAAARFIVCTGCAQRGPCGSVGCEDVLDSASALGPESPNVGVGVEVDAEACEDDAVVGPEWPYGLVNGGNTLTAGDANFVGWFSLPPTPGPLLNGFLNGGRSFGGARWLLRR